MWNAEKAWATNSSPAKKPRKSAEWTEAAVFPVDILGFA